MIRPLFALVVAVTIANARPGFHSGCAGCSPSCVPSLNSSLPEIDARIVEAGQDWHLVGAPGAAAPQSAPNTLTAAEKAQGWQLLFDGKKIEGWRGYGSESIQKDGWVVKDGTLHKPAGVRAGDIMTAKTYEDFEFAWEWKLGARGNNGVKYFITKERGSAVGHEYQMIDDAVVNDPYSSNASFYLVVKPAADKPNKPMGEWNQSRLVVRGNHVEHWLNGKKVLDYECGSPQIMQQVPKTKFKKYPGFGKKVTGHILLTDHSDPCWYRNLKIRELGKAEK